MAPSATTLHSETSGNASVGAIGKTTSGKPLKVRSYPVFDSLEDERLYRKQHLAAAYRVFAERGFDEGVAGHISVRDPILTDHFCKCFLRNSEQSVICELSNPDLTNPPRVRGNTYLDSNLNPQGSTPSQDTSPKSASATLSSSTKTEKSSLAKNPSTQQLSPSTLKSTKLVLMYTPLATLTGESTRVLAEKGLRDDCSPSYQSRKLTFPPPTHSVYGKAFSVFGRELDMITQDSLRFYKDHAVYQNFGGVVLDREEGRKIAECLGDGKAVILQNHGLITVCCGPNVIMRHARNTTPYLPAY